MNSLFRYLLILASLLLPAAAQTPATKPGTPAPAAPAATAAPDAAPSAPELAPAPDAPAAKPAKSPPKQMTAADYVDQGGPVFYVLAGLSVVACALIVFYVLTIRRGAVVSDYFMRTADALIRKQDYLGLLAVCNRRNESIASITQKALDFATKNPTATFEEVREVTQSEGQRQASQLSQRITYLADVAAIAPMIGLLGTVFGIMSAFESISSTRAADAMNMQTQFAKGTGEALINTGAGLCIAIPAMIVFSIYRGRVNALISELEAASTHIMALLAAQYKRVTAAARAQAQQAPARQGRA